LPFHLGAANSIDFGIEYKLVYSMLGYRVHPSFQLRDYRGRKHKESKHNGSGR